MKARNWLFAIASGLRALEVDANTLTSLTCNYEPDGSIVIEAPGSRRWWVKSLGSQLPFDLGSSPPPVSSPSAPRFATPPAADARVAALPDRRVDARGPNPRRNSRSPHSPTPLERAAAPVAQPIPFEDEDALSTERKGPGSPPVRSSKRPRPQHAQVPPPPAPIPSRSEPNSLTAPRAVEQRIKVVVSASSRLLEDDDSLWETGEERTPDNIIADLSVPAPALEMPRSSLIMEEPETLAERLFEASMDFIGAEPDDACQIALDLVNEFVPCEASSIAIGTLNDRELRFVAATGPVSEKIRGRRQAFGRGLIGMCFDLRSTLVVTDVKASQHHDETYDLKTGFTTFGALCVPILDEEGLSYGVIQLLNPMDRPFFDEDEEAVETIARALAGALAFA